MPELYTLDLGTIDYGAALDVQRRAALLRISGELSADLLLLCEHPPVVTLGRARTSAANVRLTTEQLARRGAALHETERGGDVTFHGPGQLVGYTIVDLKQHRKDLHWFLRQLEQVIIDACGELGVTSDRRQGLTGAWVGHRKIASIGVHARDWVTWHGFALNVSTDLSWFDTIVPCGISDVEMTSVARELAELAPVGGHVPPVVGEAARAAVIAAMANRFGLSAAPLPLPTRGLLFAETAQLAG